MEITKNETGRSRLEMLLNTELTEQETSQVVCNHRTDDDTTDTFRLNGDEVICKKCGTRFTPLSAIKKEFIQQDVDAVINILETSKIYSSKNDDYFAIIPLLKRLPEIYEILEAEFNANYSKSFNSSHSNITFNQSANQIFNVDHVDSIDDLDKWLKGEEV